MAKKQQQHNETSPSDPIRRVGYIGLGIMGTPMAMNLLEAGYELVVWNRSLAKSEPFAARGATVAKSPADVAGRGPEVVCINVTDTPDVEEVLFGEMGIARSAKQGLIVVDHSTISPTATQRFAQRLAQQGVILVDAPVSGGDVGAKAGTLSIMVGGPDAAVKRIGPMLAAVGSKVTHLGDAGKGQACKACNQIAVVSTLMGVCEALAMAKRSGLDLDKLIEAIADGAAGSWQLSNLGPKIAQGDYQPGFMIDLVLKDLAIVARTAREYYLPLGGTSAAEGYFRAVAAAGGGGLGTQAMAKTLERLGGFNFQD